MFKHILVPTDGSALSTSAVEKAINFAREVEARLTFLTALPEALPPVSSFWDSARDQTEESERGTAEARAEASRIVEAAVAQARRAGVSADTALAASNSPFEAIIQTAEERRCDLIFMASHGRRGVNALLLGSETNKVLTHCKIPVLIYR